MQPKEGEQFQCEVCGRACSTRKILKRHMRETHAEKEAAPEFRCPVCDRKFSRNSNLVRHMAVHREDQGAEQEKKYGCPHCDARFKQKCHLAEHLLIHNGTRFSCDICGKSFSRQQTLRTHVALAHGSEGSCQSTPHDHNNCKKIAFMTHDDHVDFLLSCGSIFCNSEERILSEEHVHDNESNCCPTKLHCPHEECGQQEDELSHCDHLKRARMVKHGDHYDIAFNGYLWNNAEDIDGTNGPYVNHGPLNITEINDGVEGFLEFLNKDLNSQSPVP